MRVPRTQVPKSGPVDRWIDEVEAAELIGLSISWFQRARYVGNGPPFTKLGRAVRYRLGDILAFMEARQVRSTSGCRKPEHHTCDQCEARINTAEAKESTAEALRRAEE